MSSTENNNFKQQQNQEDDPVLSSSCPPPGYPFLVLVQYIEHKSICSVLFGINVWKLALLNYD